MDPWRTVVGRGAFVALATLVLAGEGAQRAGRRCQFPAAGRRVPGSTTRRSGGSSPALAALPAGGFVATWSSPSGIVVRRLDHDRDAAAARHAGESRRRHERAGAGGSPVGGPSSSSGTPPIPRAGGSSRRRFDASGQPLGAPYPVNLSLTGDQVDPRVAAGPIGYAMAWTSANVVVGRLLDPTGIPLGVEIPVGPGQKPAVAWRGNGLAFAWTDTSINAPVWVRLFDGAGAPMGPAAVANGSNPFLPCCFPSYTRSAIGVASAANGSFAVSWDLSGTSAAGGLLPFWYYQFGSFVRRYDPSGVPMAPETRVNVYADGAQDGPSLAMATGGQALVAWSSAPVFEGCTFWADLLSPATSRRPPGRQRRGRLCPALRRPRQRRRRRGGPPERYDGRRPVRARRRRRFADVALRRVRDVRRVRQGALRPPFRRDDDARRVRGRPHRRAVLRREPRARELGGRGGGPRVAEHHGLRPGAHERGRRRSPAPAARTTTSWTAPRASA